MRDRFIELPDRDWLESLINVEHDRAVNGLSDPIQTQPAPQAEIRPLILADDPEPSLEDRYSEMLRKMGKNKGRTSDHQQPTSPTEVLRCNLLAVIEQWESIRDSFDANDTEAAHEAILSVASRAGRCFIEQFAPLAAKVVAHFGRGKFPSSLPLPDPPEPSRIRPAGHSLEDFFDTTSVREAGLRLFVYGAIADAPEKWDRPRATRGHLEHWARHLLTQDRRTYDEYESDIGRMASSVPTFQFHGADFHPSGDPKPIAQGPIWKRIRTWVSPLKECVLRAFDELVAAAASSKEIAIGNAETPSRMIDGGRLIELRKIKWKLDPDTNFIGEAQVAAHQDGIHERVNVKIRETWSRRKQA